MFTLIMKHACVCVLCEAEKDMFIFPRSSLDISRNRNAKSSAMMTKLQ